MIDKDTEPWQLEGSFSLEDLKSDQRGGPPRQSSLYPSLNTGQSDSAYIFEWMLFSLALEKGEIFSRIPRRKLSVTKPHKTRMKLNYDQPFIVISKYPEERTCYHLDQFFADANRPAQV